ncbi:MAG: ABC transporter ATP-binding protein [Lachnospiraceae bacterium]|nr:ABC transporter ATP-binding protein [Lachnospiraceae bacterium]
MDNKTIIKKVWNYIKPYRILIAFAFLLTFFSVGLTLYIPILVGDAIDCIVVNMFNRKIFSILLRVIICAMAAAGSQWGLAFIYNKITYQVVRDMRNEAFQKIQKLPVAYMDQHMYGDTVSRMITDVDQFSDGLLMGFSQLFTGILTILATIFFMFSMHIGITVLVILLTPLSLFVAQLIAKKTYSRFLDQSRIRGIQTGKVEEMIGNQMVVRAFSREEKNLEEFDTINEALSQCSLKAFFYSSLTNPSTRLINNIVYACVGLCGAYVSIKGMLTLGQLACYLSYANQYTKPFNEISGVVTELQNAIACAGRIFALMEEKEEEEADGYSELVALQGKVDLEHVFFSYEPEQKLIEDLSLHVQKGQKIAIVGPTGCGKTTLINLLMRFYDPVKGSIRLDDLSIQQMKRQQLRNQIGMVLQETWIKTGTVLENITMGRPDATREEVISAAKASYSHSFIKRLPQGYDTLLTENGEALSQGQRQLLCIARVMLCLPPILILDEATSSIDTRTEKKIQQAFQKMMEGRTSFIVAHRLSTIQDADVILVMKDGNVIEQGNHDALLKKNGFYATLYHHATHIEA